MYLNKYWLWIVEKKQVTGLIIITDQVHEITSNPNWKEREFNLKPVLEGVGFNRRPYTDLLDFHYNVQKGD